MTQIAGRLQDPLGLASFQLSFERALRRWLEPLESNVDSAWIQAREALVDVALRPAKRVRPTLLALGYGMVKGRVDVEAVVDFGVGLELLHAFMLVHDDVADRAPTRRGGPALHVMMGGAHLGDSKAAVLGDYLYARAFEAMLSVPNASKATRFMLETCRWTAAGQLLDLSLSERPLAEVRIGQVLQVARLKTARYGFVAPLVCGAMLAGGTEEQLEALERLGESAGLAFQLQDDLLGLFGNDAVAGKSGGGDYLEGKRTFPVIAAWIRAEEPGRDQLEALWQRPAPTSLAAARDAVIQAGGLFATERVISRMIQRAQRGLAALPPSECRAVLGELVARFASRAA